MDHLYYAFAFFQHVLFSLIVIAQKNQSMENNLQNFIFRILWKNDFCVNYSFKNRNSGKRKVEQTLNVCVRVIWWTIAELPIIKASLYKTHFAVQQLKSPATCAREK